MKRLFSLLFVVALIFAFSITSMALVSPGGTVYHEIYVNRTHTGSNSKPAERVTVISGDTHDLIPVQTEKLEFVGWDFYRKDMNYAVEGVDYEIVKVSLSDGRDAVKGKDYTISKGRVIAKDGKYIIVKIKPLVDTVYVSENFKGVKIKFNISDTTVLSPVTGVQIDYTVVVALSFVILAAGAVALSTKKFGLKD